MAEAGRRLGKLRKHMSHMSVFWQVSDVGYQHTPALFKCFLTGLRILALLEVFESCLVWARKKMTQSQAAALMGDNSRSLALGTLTCESSFPTNIAAHEASNSIQLANLLGVFGGMFKQLQGTLVENKLIFRHQAFQSKRSKKQHTPCSIIFYNMMTQHRCREIHFFITFKESVTTGKQA